MAHSWLQQPVCALDLPAIARAELNLAVQMCVLIVPPPDVCQWNDESWAQFSSARVKIRKWGVFGKTRKWIWVACVCVCGCSCWECILSGRSAPHAAAEQTGFRHQLRRCRQRVQEGWPTGWALLSCTINTSRSSWDKLTFGSLHRLQSFSNNHPILSSTQI